MNKQLITTGLQNLKKLIPWSFLAILIFLVVYLWDNNRTLNHQIKNAHKELPDTVDVDKPIKIVTEYRGREVPKEIIKYVEKEIKVDSVVYVDKIVYIHTEDSTKTISYPEEFLTRYPNNDKLLFIDFNNKNLKLGLLQPSDGNSIEQRYSIDLDRFSYRYVNNELTSQKKKFVTKLYFTGGYQLRPFNNFHDINAGISYNTKFINYEFGINGYWYGSFEKKVGYGPYLKIKFEF